MRTRTALVALTGTTTVFPALANIGVPMVAVFLPPLWLALVPVIAIESWILMRLLKVPVLPAAKGSTLGNILSTFAGVPFMWMALATVQLVYAGTALGLATPATRVYAVTVQAPWLIPYEEDLGWMIPSALLVLALPAYALSVLIEWLAMLAFLESNRRPGTLRAVAIANAASYLLLALLFIVTLRLQGLLQPVYAAFHPASNWFMESVFALAQQLTGEAAK